MLVVGGLKPHEWTHEFHGYQGITPWFVRIKLMPKVVQEAEYLYGQSTPVLRIDYFISHCWSDDRSGKVFALWIHSTCGEERDRDREREREREREKRCCLFMSKASTMHYLCNIYIYIYHVTYITCLYFLNKATGKVPLPLLPGNLNAAMLISTALAVSCASLCRARVLPVVAPSDLDFEFFPWALILGFTTFFLILATWQNVVARFQSTQYFLDKHLGNFQIIFVLPNFCW